MRVLVILSLASLLAAPAVAADEGDPGIYPCQGGYYVDLGSKQTECLPGLGYTGTKPCAGPYGDGTAFWLNGEELFCLY